MNVSVIIPAFNEAKNISSVLAVLKECLSSGNVEEVIVIDDGSRDQTAEVAKRFDISVLVHERNLGKGAAIQTGFDAAKGDILLLLDADLIGLKSSRHCSIRLRKEKSSG